MLIIPWSIFKMYYYEHSVMLTKIYNYKLYYDSDTKYINEKCPDLIYIALFVYNMSQFCISSITNHWDKIQRKIHFCKKITPVLSKRYNVLFSCSYLNDNLQFKTFLTSFKLYNIRYHFICIKYYSEIQKKKNFKSNKSR